MPLREAVEKLEKWVEDLSSLHVQTYTGRVEVDLSGLGEDEHAADRVRDAMANATNAEGTVKLVAESYFQFDGDSYNFLTDETAPAKALEMHMAAVEAGQATRRSLVELVKSVL